LLANQAEQFEKHFEKKGMIRGHVILLPADDGSRFHIQGDALEAIKQKWDLIIAHPPCTFLCGSGIHWLQERKKNTATEQQKEKERVVKRKIDTEWSKKFFMAFTKLDCKFCIENPIGIMSRLYRKPDQIIHPYNFGHDASKRTCLWLNKLEPLERTQSVAPRMVNYGGKMRRRWSNQTDSGMEVKKQDL
jgi:hypothetical protein